MTPRPLSMLFQHIMTIGAAGIGDKTMATITSSVRYPCKHVLPLL